MEKKELIRQAMEQNSVSVFPNNSSVVNPVIERLTGIQSDRDSRWVRSPVVAILLAIVAVAVIATAAFAVYHYLLDPGLQAVKDAGLGEQVNTTALATLNPQLPTDSYQPLPATLIGIEQNLDGVTVSLDWISVNNMRVLFGFSAIGLEQGMSFELPRVTFFNPQQEQYRGAAFELNGDSTVNGEYISYQVINDPSLEGKIDIGIDLPLIRSEDNLTNVLRTFHFDLKSIPMDTGQPASGQQTYAAKVNGFEVSLEWIKVTPGLIGARICYATTPSEKEWTIKNLSLEIGSGNYQFDNATAAYATLSNASDIGNQRCMDASLPIVANNPPHLIKLSIDELISATENQEGPWDFYVMLPENGPAPKYAIALTPTPTEQPLAVETVGDLQATMKWVYADASQVAMEIHFEGWQEDYFLGGFSIKDDNGVEINTGYGSLAAADDPSTQLVTLYPDQQVLQSGSFGFHLDFPVYVRQGENQPTAIASFHFDLNLPVYQARVYTFDHVVSANGLGMRLLKAEMTPASTVLTLCFSKPTHGDWSDWMPGYASELQVGENKAQGGGGGVIYDTDFGGYVTKGSFSRDLPANVNGRCVKVNFPVGDLAKPGPLSMILTVPELQISMPEGFPAERINATLTKLRTEGIDMTFFMSNGSGGGGGGYSFNRKPEDMSDEEAYHKFLEALGFIYAGPWVFTVTIP
jgi:hypothetical protein